MSTTVLASLAMEYVDAESQKYNVGDRIQISLNNQIIDATVRAVIPQTERLLLFTSLVASAIFDCTLGI